MPTEILLIGAGGHAKVVLSALRLCAPGARIRILDDDPKLAGKPILDCVIEAGPGDPAGFPEAVHVCIGNNRTRQAVAEKWQRAGKRLWSIVHPSAVVAPEAVVGEGSFVAAGAIIGPDARIGFAGIVNHGAVVDHDCRLGACCHVAPGASLGGGVAAGVGVLVGAGARVLPGITIGDYAVIGAGAVVTQPVSAGQTVAGIPARAVR